MSPERYNFEICNMCGLVWADDMGLNEGDCPRCIRQAFIDDLESRLDDAESDRDTAQERVEDLESELQDIENKVYSALNPRR